MDRASAYQASQGQEEAAPVVGMGGAHLFRYSHWCGIGGAPLDPTPY